jgi:hypothetical protein
MRKQGFEPAASSIISSSEGGNGDILLFILESNVKLSIIYFGIYESFDAFISMPG